MQQGDQVDIDSAQSHYQPGLLLTWDSILRNIIEELSIIIIDPKNERTPRERCPPRHADPGPWTHTPSQKRNDWAITLHLLSSNVNLSFCLTVLNWCPFLVFLSFCYSPICCTKCAGGWTGNSSLKLAWERERDINLTSRPSKQDHLKGWIQHRIKQ